MNPPASPKSEWRALMDEMAVAATEEYSSIVFQEPRFVEYFRLTTPEMEYGRMNIGSRPSKRKPPIPCTTGTAAPGKFNRALFVRSCLVSWLDWWLSDLFSLLFLTQI
ncbi:hypothetical protein ACLB2K_066852 [Fragaria x ananassa]